MEKFYIVSKEFDTAAPVSGFSKDELATRYSEFLASREGNCIMTVEEYQDWRMSR